MNSNVTICFIKFSSINNDLSNIKSQNTMMDAHQFMTDKDPYKIPTFDEIIKQDCTSAMQDVSKSMTDVRKLYTTYYKINIKSEQGESDQSGNRSGKNGDKNDDKKRDEIKANDENQVSEANIKFTLNRDIGGLKS